MRILFLILTTLLYFPSKAQTRKGSVFVNGSAGYWSSDLNRTYIQSVPGNRYDYKYATLTGVITSGLFIKDGLAVGPMVSVTRVRMEWKDSRTTQVIRDIITDNVMGFGALLRGYKLNTEGRFGVFLQFSGQYLLLERKERYISKGPGFNPPEQVRSTRSPGFTAALEPGFVYFITDRLGLEARMGLIKYTFIKGGMYDGNVKVNKLKESELRAGILLSDISMGITWFFGTKKRADASHSNK